MTTPLPPVPFLAPPVWTEHPSPGRFAHAILTNTSDFHQDAVLAEQIRKCSVMLIGLPDDLGITLNRGRPGAALGPNAFRHALASFGVAEPHSWTYPKVFDAGNIIPSARASSGSDEQTLHETHQRITTTVRALLEATDGKLLPVAIGGGHDLTFPFVRAVIEFWQARGVAVDSGVYFDAHLDVRPTVGSGMPFRALIEHCQVRDLALVGFDELVNAREHLEYFHSHGGVLINPEDSGLDWLPYSHDISSPVSRVAFASFDLDCVDAAYAPGVSAMNTAGMTPKAARACASRAGADPRICCFDIMELCPPHDDRHRTTRLAASIFLSFLKGLATRRCPTPLQ